MGLIRIWDIFGEQHVLKKFFGGSRSPVCFKCGGLASAGHRLSGWNHVQGRDLQGLQAVTCLSCQGAPPNKPCRKCGGAVSPAFGDLLAR